MCSNDDNVKSNNIVDFVLNIRNRIRTSVKIVNEIEEKIRKNLKSGVTERQEIYEVGEQVLLFLDDVIYM